MPKATMNQNAKLEFSKNKVRLARKISPVQAKPESPSMKKFPDQNLGPGIFCPYDGHHSRPSLRVNNIHLSLFLQPLLPGILAVDFAAWLPLQ